MVLKLVLMPALTFGLAVGAATMGWLTLLQAQVLCLLSTMPAAITTFAIAQELSTGREQTARAIVLTTTVGAVTIPFAAWVARSLLPLWV